MRGIELCVSPLICSLDEPATCRIFAIPPSFLPAPLQVLAAIVQYWVPIVDNSFQTLWTTLAGFLLAIVFGVALGIAVGWSRAIYTGPYFFGSLKVAITLAFVGAVVSETVGANKGVGYLMLNAQAAFQVPLVFAGLIALAVLGIVLYGITALIERRFTRWAYRGSMAA